MLFILKKNGPVQVIIDGRLSVFINTIILVILILSIVCIILEMVIQCMAQVPGMAL